MPGIIHASLVRDGRRRDRDAVGRSSTLRGDDGNAVDIQIENFSAYGCGLTTNIWLAEGEMVHIGLPGIGAVPARIIWSNSQQAGCAFLHQLSPTKLAKINYDDNVVPAVFRAEAMEATQPAPFLDRPRLKRSGRLVFALSASWAAVLVAGYSAYWVLT